MKSAVPLSEQLRNRLQQCPRRGSRRSFRESFWRPASFVLQYRRRTDSRQQRVPVHRARPCALSARCADDSPFPHRLATWGSRTARQTEPGMPWGKTVVDRSVRVFALQAVLHAMRWCKQYRAREHSHSRIAARPSSEERVLLFPALASSDDGRLLVPSAPCRRVISSGPRVRQP
jgi:hypothetical protein